MAPWTPEALVLSGELKAELEKNERRHGMTAELVPVEPQQLAPQTLFGTDNPKAIIASAVAKADALAEVIRQKKLSSTISGREYVRLEGWSLLGTMLGVFPICVWTRQVENGWEARVEARTLDGNVVGTAEAQCCRDEQTWRNRPDYALRSMAQTRATSKALRMPLGFVMSLGGFDPTPADEMDVEDARPARQPMRQTAKGPMTIEQPRPRPENVDEDGVVHDITKSTSNAIAEAYHRVRQARGAEEFAEQVRPEMQRRWGHAFLANSNRLSALSEAEGFDVLAWLHGELPMTDEEQAALT